MGRLLSTRPAPSDRPRSIRRSRTLEMTLPYLRGSPWRMSTSRDAYSSPLHSTFRHRHCHLRLLFAPRPLSSSHSTSFLPYPPSSYLCYCLSSTFFSFLFVSAHISRMVVIVLIVVAGCRPHGRRLYFWPIWPIRGAARPGLPRDPRSRRGSWPMSRASTIDPPRLLQRSGISSRSLRPFDITSGRTTTASGSSDERDGMDDGRSITTPPARPSPIRTCPPPPKKNPPPKNPPPPPQKKKKKTNTPPPVAQ